MAPKRETRNYTQEEVELGLAALVVHLGNARQAHKSLKKRGTHVPVATLDGWRRNTHAERYEQVRNEMREKIKPQIAEEARDIARDSMEVARELVARTRKEKGDIPARDLPGAARNLSVSAGILLEKANLYDDQPTQILARRDPVEILRALKAKGVVIGIDGEAEEIEDAEVVDAPELEAA